MPKFTCKQEMFIKKKAEGAPTGQAALLAGYAPNSVSVTASKLLKRADIRSAIAAANKSKSGAAITQIRSEPKFRGNYASPLKFLFDVMNTENMPMRMRFEAAKQLLPYFHARIGAKGKKDSEIDKALIVSRSGRFAPKLPPKLTLVQSDKPESAPL